MRLHSWRAVKGASLDPWWIPWCHQACADREVALILQLAHHGLDDSMVEYQWHGLSHGGGCGYHCYCCGNAPVHNPCLLVPAPFPVLLAHFPCRWELPRPVQKETNYWQHKNHTPKFTRSDTKTCKEKPENGETKSFLWSYWTKLAGTASHCSNVSLTRQQKRVFKGSYHKFMWCFNWLGRILFNLLDLWPVGCGDILLFYIFVAFIPQLPPSARTLFWWDREVKHWFRT